MYELTFEEIEESIRQNPIEQIKDQRDFIFEEIAGVDPDIPEFFSLRDKMTPVKNQGKRGTCTSFAGCAYAEFFNSLEFRNPDLDLSEEYLFKRIKEIDLIDYNYSGYGAYGRSCCKALQKFGTCLEKTAPYNFNGSEDSWQTLPMNASMDLEADIYKINTYASVQNKTVEGLKNAIYSSQRPLVTGVILYGSYRSAKTNGGILPIPKSGETKIGGHYMLMVGFNDNKRRFELKNSWGEKWGDKGYLYLPYEALSTINGSVYAFVDMNQEDQEKKILEANAGLCKSYQRISWDKATKKGLVTPGTKPNDVLTKGDYFVFLDREGRLG